MHEPVQGAGGRQSHGVGGPYVFSCEMPAPSIMHRLSASPFSSCSSASPPTHP